MYRRVHIWLKEDKYYLKDKITADIQLYAEVWAPLAKLHVLLIFEVKSTQPLEKTILKILNFCKY